MTDRILVAAVQTCAGEDKEANVRRAVELVEQAAGSGAQIVALPELFNCLGRFPAVVAAAEPVPGPTSEAMRELAARLRITLLAGSICERGDVQGKGYNTSILYAPDGGELARYRKMHLFDVDLPGRVSVTESNWIVPGDRAVTAETEFGRAGLSICYDLRFAELYRRLADEQVEILFVPSAFAQATGQDHWEVLLRARAIENQAFVIAPNQCGDHAGIVRTYGNSMIVDPWGKVLARAGDDEEIVFARLDTHHLREVRRQLPALTHRRHMR